MVMKMKANPGFKKVMKVNTTNFLPKKQESKPIIHLFFNRGNSPHHHIQGDTIEFCFSIR
jgi:hypothetical protein